MNQSSSPEVSLWSAEQRACLAELGIPVWQYAPAQSAAPEPTPDTSGHRRPESTEPAKPQAEQVHPEPAQVGRAHSDQAQPESAQAAPNAEAGQIPVIYQLHIWHFAFPELPPAGLYPWLNDLAKAFASSPVQVKQPAEAPLVDCAPYTKASLSPTEKRTLWEAMKAAARQAGRDW